MKIPLTHRSITNIIKDWDILYIKNYKKPNGYYEPDNYIIFINIANQSLAETGKTLLHEILHIHYENHCIYPTELQIEAEAERYYRKSDLLDFIHSFL